MTGTRKTARPAVWARAKHGAWVCTLHAALGLLAAALLHEASAQANPDGAAIMQRVLEARKLEGAEALLRMRIYNSAGQVRERTLSMASKLYDGGHTEKRIYRFLAPAEIKGTTILTFDYDDKADDVWLYLPELKKTRRILSAQSTKSFMGSEFSFGDLQLPELEHYDYRVLRQERYADDDCSVLDETPKASATADGYSKKTYWVSRATSTVRRVLYYGSRGQLLKELKTDKVRLVDPEKQRYRALFFEMTNRENGRRSVFETEKMALAPNIKDEYFTLHYLERP